MARLKVALSSWCACAVALVVGACGGQSDAPAEPPAPLTEGAPCPPGTVPLVDGSCRAAGVPAERCAAGFEPDGADGCRAILPAEPCAPGELAVPGDLECQPIADCGADTWGKLAIEPDTEHVDASYAGADSDGSADRPWTRIQRGVDAAADGALVAVAAGTYQEDVLVSGKAVRLAGRCPSMVKLEGVGSYYWALSFETGSAGSGARGMSISGPVDAVLVSGATDVVLEQVHIHDTGDWGLDVQSNLGPAQATLTRSLIEATHVLGVFVDGPDAELHVDRSAVRDVAPDTSPTGATAVLVQGRAQLSMTQSLVERPPDYGVRAVHATMMLEGVLVRDQIAVDGMQGGVLVSADIDTGEAADATIAGVVID